jgi:hypothetical protein
VFAFWIIKHFDVFEHIPSGIVAGGIDLPPDLLAFQQLEETFSYGVVITVSTSAHAGFQIVLTKKLQPLATGKLATLIGMDGDSFLWLAPPNGHHQSLQNNIRCHP